MCSSQNAILRYTMLTRWQTPAAHFQSEAPHNRSDKTQDTSLYSRGNKTRACTTEVPGHIFNPRPHATKVTRHKTRACTAEATRHEPVQQKRPGTAEKDAKERREAHPQLLRYTLPPAPFNVFTAGAEPLGQAHEPLPTTGTKGRTGTDFIFE